MILAPLQKLPKNVEHLGKLIVAKGFKKLPKSTKKSPTLVTLPPMHQGIESVHQGVLRWFSDLASAENSVKKRTQFFSHHKTGTRSSKFVFYDFTDCPLPKMVLVTHP